MHNSHETSIHVQLAGSQLKIIAIRSVHGCVLNGRIPFSLSSLHCATYVEFNFRDCQLPG